MSDISLEERKEFDLAKKKKEIKNCVVNDVLDKLHAHEKPPRASILRMRWSTVQMTIRIMDGIVCSQATRRWSIPARPQASARSLGTASTRTGGCSERVSWRSHEVEEGSLWTGRGARGVVHQHFCSAGRTRLRRLKSDPCCWILIDPAAVKKDNTQRFAATGELVDDCVFVENEGNKVWETAREQLQDHFRWKMWDTTIS